MTQPDYSGNISDMANIGRSFRVGLSDILGDKLFSAYFYGATVFPETKYTGDIDFHVILTEPLTDGERAELNGLHETLAREYPPLGADMDGYYILLEDAKRRSPPRSQMWKRATDDSWALHREHLRAGRCIVLVGPNPANLYPTTSWAEL